MSYFFPFGISANNPQNYFSQADWIGPSVAKTLLQYGLKLVKFGNKKLELFHIIIVRMYKKNISHDLSAVILIFGGKNTW